MAPENLPSVFTRLPLAKAVVWHGCYLTFVLKLVLLFKIHLSGKFWSVQSYVALSQVSGGTSVFKRSKLILLAFVEWQTHWAVQPVPLSPTHRMCAGCILHRGALGGLASGESVCNIPGSQERKKHFCFWCGSLIKPFYREKEVKTHPEVHLFLHYPLIILAWLF